MGWRITWRGASWSDADLTVGHMAVIIQMQGIDSFEFLDPFAGPVKLMGIVAAFVGVAEQRDVATVLAELAPHPMSELLGALTRTDDDEVSPVAATGTYTADIDDGPDGGVAAVVTTPPAPTPDAQYLTAV